MTNINASENDKGDGHLDYSISDIKLTRESKGLTLKGISEATKISMNHLQAIENGEFQLLPPPVYSKSFIKKYAEAVGIESSSLLTHYEKYLSANHKEPLEQINPEQERPHKTALFFVVAGLCLAAVIGAMFMISSPTSKINDQDKIIAAAPPTPAQPPAIASLPETTMQNQKERSAPTAETSAVKTAPADIKTDSAAPPAKAQNMNAPTPVKPEKASASDKPQAADKSYLLTVQATEKTWLRITGDNERPYDILLKPGERIERRAAERFVIACGNAGGVDIVFQGKSLGPLGKQGQVVHLTLP